MAAFNGVDLGIVEEWETTAAPKDRQVNAYNGVAGLESIDLGARGGRTLLSGALAGVNEADLARLKAGFRAMQINGGAAVFVDPENVPWGDVVLVLFRAHGPRYRLAGDAGFAQRYEAEFLHLD